MFSPGLSPMMTTRREVVQNVAAPRFGAMTPPIPLTTHGASPMVTRTTCSDYTHPDARLHLQAQTDQTLGSLILPTVQFPKPLDNILTGLADKLQ